MPYTELVEDRLRFLEIDKEVLEELKRARQYIEPEIDNMLAGFYALILQDVALHALFKDADSVKHAREAQKKHWLKNVLSGKYGSADRLLKHGEVVAYFQEYVRIEATAPQPVLKTLQQALDKLSIVTKRILVCLQLSNRLQSRRD